MYTAIRMYDLLPEAVGGGVSSLPENRVLLILAWRAPSTGSNHKAKRRAE